MESGEVDTTAIAKEHQVSTVVVKNLLAGGVKHEDLDEVLGIKQFLTDEYHKNESTTGRLKSVVNGASAASVAEAYKVVNGDVDELRSLAETARDFFKEGRVTTLSSALREVTESYQDGGMSQFLP